MHETNRRKLDMEERKKNEFPIGKKCIIKIKERLKGKPTVDHDCNNCVYELEDSNKGQCKNCSWHSHWTPKKEELKT